MSYFVKRHIDMTNKDSKQDVFALNLQFNLYILKKLTVCEDLFL